MFALTRQPVLFYLAVKQDHPPGHQRLFPTTL